MKQLYLVFLIVLCSIEASQFGYRLTPTGTETLIQHAVRYAFGVILTIPDPFTPTSITVRIAAASANSNTRLQVGIFDPVTNQRICENLQDTSDVVTGDLLVPLSCPNLAPGTYGLGVMLANGNNGYIMTAHVPSSIASSYFVVGTQNKNLPNLWSSFSSSSPDVFRIWMNGIDLSDACVSFPCAAGSPGEACSDIYDAPNTTAGRSCPSCSAGLYSPSGLSCVNINACLTFPCFSGVSCTDLPAPALNASTGRTCGACPTGYSGNGDSCVNTNACLNNPCFTGVQCTDLDPPALGTAAGRTCAACPPGYQGNGAVCTNINACLNNPCFSGVTCTDLGPPALDNPEGRTCGACPSGYQGDGVTCTNIDACLNNPCFTGVGCTDLGPPALDNPAGRTCGACPAGFSGNGASCVDINACLNNPCFTGVDCTDLPAPALDNPQGRICDACPNGYFGDGVTCTNIDACLNNPCFTDVDCTDLAPPALDNPEGRTCGACPDGFQGNGVTCTNIDACLNNPCFTGVDCTDLEPPALDNPEGRICGNCPAGYSGDGTSCVNIDACVNFPCFSGVFCEDLQPPALDDESGRHCSSCPPGFSGDGDSCEDIDACIHNPCASSENITCGDLAAPALDNAEGRVCSGVPDPVLVVNGQVDSCALTVQWDFPNENSFPLTSCDVQIQRSTIYGTSSNVYSLGVVNEYVISGVRAGTYLYRVRCDNSFGTGEWSNWGEEVAYTMWPGNMKTPTLVSKTTDSVTIQWIAPADYYCPISTYQIKYLDNADPFDIETGSGAVNEFTLSGLNGNTEYSFKVRAVNAVGFGKYSNLLTVTTN